MARFLNYPTLDSSEAVEATSNQQRLCQTTQMYKVIGVVAGRMSYCRFCRAPARILFLSLDVSRRGLLKWVRSSVRPSVRARVRASFRPSVDTMR